MISKVISFIVFVCFMFIIVLSFILYKNNIKLKNDNKELNEKIVILKNFQYKLDLINVDKYPLFGGYLNTIKDKVELGELEYLNDYINNIPNSTDEFRNSEWILKSGYSNYSFTEKLFICPLDIKGCVVSSEYGKSLLYFWNKKEEKIIAYNRTHTGIDLANPKNKRVYASYGGRVIGVGFNDEFYGTWILIEHNINGIEKRTFYGHLKKINVEEGNLVSIGDEIAVYGNTGWSFGPHLHYELHERINGIWNSENPMVNSVLGGIVTLDNYMPSTFYIK